MKTNPIRILAYALTLVAVSITHAQEQKHDPAVNLEQLFLNFSIESDGKVTDDFTLGITTRNNIPRGETFQIDRSSGSSPPASIRVRGTIEKIDSTSYLLSYQFSRKIPIESETPDGKKVVQYHDEGTESSLKVTLGDRALMIKDLNGMITVLLSEEAD